MKESKILRDYNDCSKTIFELISGIGLEWCKVIVSDSGWMSDNCLSYVRLINWFHYPICMLNLKDSLMGKYVEPNIPLKNWYVKMYKDWLKAHEVKFNGSASQLKNEIRSFKHNVILLTKFIDLTLGLWTERYNILHGADVVEAKMEKEKIV